jgi:hypothetical protein
MSFQATKFIVALTDLTPAEKAVAHTLAYHADKDGGNAYPSMETIARESGLQSRRSAQRIVRQLETKKIIYPTTAKTGGRGRDKATVYRLDLAYQSPVNSDAQVALSDAKPRPAEQESATQETLKRDIQVHKQRHPGRTNSPEESRRVSEEDEHQSSVQQPHTPFNPLHAMEEKQEIERNQTSIPDHQNQEQTSPDLELQAKSTPSKNKSSPNQPVKSSKKVTAPEVIRAPFGSPEWWNARQASMSDEEQVLAAISAIELSNNRRFDCNSKIRQIVSTKLAIGVPKIDIVEAAEDFGRTLTEKDKMPGVALAQNLSQEIDTRAWRKAGDAKGREQREKSAERDQLVIAELTAQTEHRKMAAQGVSNDLVAAGHFDVDDEPF